LAPVHGVALDLATVQTNIVLFKLTQDAPPTDEVVASARNAGVLINAFGPRTIRAVTHLDVTDAQCRQAGEVLAQVIGGG
jgi:threonine aldolase